MISVKEAKDIISKHGSDQTSVLIVGWGEHKPATPEDRRQWQEELMMLRLGRRPKGYNRSDWYHTPRDERNDL